MLCTSFFGSPVRPSNASISSARFVGLLSSRKAIVCSIVGSVPMANAGQVFESVSAAFGPRIKRIPDGETGERGDWITWLEPIFARHPAFESLTPIEQAAHLATRSGLAPERIAEALAFRSSPDPGKFASDVAVLEKLRRSL